MTISVDGRLTSQNELTGALDGSAVMYIVSPGNAAQGVSYKVTLATLSSFFGGFSLTLVTSGAVYNSVAADVRILINKTIGSPTTVNLLGGASYLQPLLVKDIKGDAATNPITIVFPGTYDGIASPFTIDTNYGWIWFNPLPTGNFYAAD